MANYQCSVIKWSLGVRYIILWCVCEWYQSATSTWKNHGNISNGSKVTAKNHPKCHECNDFSCDKEINHDVPM